MRCTRHTARSGATAEPIAAICGSILPSCVRAEHATVPVERGELLGQLQRVGGDAVRRSTSRRLPTSAGNASSLLISARSAGMQSFGAIADKRIGALAGARQRQPHLLGAGPGKHRGDTRVRVLHVVHGVLARLLAREIEVEVDRGVVRA